MKQRSERNDSLYNLRDSRVSVYICKRLDFLENFKESHKF